MIRAIALAAILGALTAAAAVYTFTAPRPQTKLAATVDKWPICTTMGSLADSADWAQLDPDFAAGKKAMAAGEVARAPKSGSHRTHRWRERDSNFRFRAKGATDLSLRCCLCP